LSIPALQQKWTWEDVVALIGNELKFGRGKMHDMEEKDLNEKPLIKNENPITVMIVPFDQDEKKKPRDGSGKDK
jgi:hypothetical protein